MFSVLLRSKLFNLAKKHSDGGFDLVVPWEAVQKEFSMLPHRLWMGELRKYFYVVPTHDLKQMVCILERATAHELQPHVFMRSWTY